MFEIGNRVRIKSEWCYTASEHEQVYTVVAVNDKTQRCFIRLSECGLPFVPTELVSFEMIEKI
jgi:hypothetical protein